jgi:hypothetical protein
MVLRWQPRLGNQGQYLHFSLEPEKGRIVHVP